MSGVLTPTSSTSTIFENLDRRIPTWVEEEAAREERRAEQYGGDDPQDPEPRDSVHVSSIRDEKSDRNKVDWEGPDDPENPQNWPVRRKWFITALCLVMTVNV